jgi:U4/U6 small nuclear ribonucleoprotein PRP3
MDVKEAGVLHLCLTQQFKLPHAPFFCARIIVGPAPGGHPSASRSVTSQKNNRTQPYRPTTSKRHFVGFYTDSGQCWGRSELDIKRPWKPGVSLSPDTLSQPVMADVTNVLKRPHPEDEESQAQKKSRSSNGSPLPVTNGSSTAASNPDVDKMLADARARAAALRARLQGTRGGGGSENASTTALATASPPTNSGAMSRIEQMKARVAAATARAGSASHQHSTALPPPSHQPPVYDDGLRARGGLDVGLHPALMGDSGQDPRSSKGRQAMQPKFATTMANRRTGSPIPATTKPTRQLDLSGPSLEETKSNPYFDNSLGNKTASVKPRQSRQLLFNQKGKYIQQAAALRRQAQLEAMKKRIAERARQAGIDEDLDAEKAFLIPAPPTIEWWDEGLVNKAEYSSIDNPSDLKIDTEDSIITLYIQHPVLLPPPQEKNVPAPKPMFLTPKEQAKLRRQRRMADLKEQQDKIRLGLEPAPPPKVKKSNLMRVLGEEAVKDPTAVEARVNREIAERAQKHVDTNEARKLTKEQRHEKLAVQQNRDAAKGIHVSVYKIDSLANGRHRFKIAKNAEQNALTGICVLNPKFCLVIVEGGEHSVNAFKKLMLNRIDWTENPGPSAAREGNKEALQQWLQAEDEKGILRDLGMNKCTLVWEGEEKTRAFRKWLGARVCETDGKAKETLSRAKMENFWAVSKSMK